MKQARLNKDFLLLLNDVYAFARTEGVELYLVGGVIRDAFLGRAKEPPDFDFCLRRQALTFGRKLARKIGCGFVVLDREHGACRLVLKRGEGYCTLDFTDFKGATLTEDLLRRDFTVNSLASELGAVLANKGEFSASALIDPHGGLHDLKKARVRVTHKNAFDDDPLRIMRALSLAATFGFTIEQRTLQLMKAKRQKLLSVSGERIRDELFKILEHDNSHAYIVLMDKLGIIDVVFPEFTPMRGVYQGPYHHLDVWRHTLETLRQLEKLYATIIKNRRIREYLEAKICAERRRKTLMKLGALFHDVGKPAARRRKGGKTIFHGHERLGARISDEIAIRLKLSNDEADSLKKMVFWHLRPGYLADSEKPSSRAVFRYFRDASQEGLSTLILSVADQRATRGKLTSRASRLQHERVVKNLIRRYLREEKKTKLRRLITGDDLIAMGLTPSPLFGKILSEVEELQAIGKLKEKEQGLAFVRTYIKVHGRAVPGEGS